MKVFVAYGGTDVKIDSIRRITNNSGGRFGSEIVDAFVRRMDESNDGTIGLAVQLRSRRAVRPWANGIRGSVDYKIFEYEYFEEYAELYRRILIDYQPDIIVLNAAVSDFTVDPVHGKIDSKNGFNIAMKPTPKLIKEARELCPNAVICGFKCTVGDGLEVRLNKALKQISECNADLCVANAWETIKDPDHQIEIVSTDGKAWDYFIHRRTTENLAREVVNACVLEYENKKKVANGG